jgi:hypothetical protein
MSTQCGWYEGYFKRFNATSATPYVVRWCCKPPIEMEVSEKTIRKLVQNYRYCVDDDIFEGIVGKELLWVVAETPSKFSLRVVKIIRFPTKGSRLYELAFRDGVIMELTPQDVDRAVARDERIRDGKAVINNFTDAMAMEV